MSKADKLKQSASFGNAVSARRAAIGAATTAPTTGVPDPTELPVTQISQNPANPREELRDLDAITQSIEELGLINAITVSHIDAYLSERPDGAKDLDEGATHIVVDGHRRLEGARRAGLTTIKVYVDDARVATDESLLEAAFVANYHNDQMTDLEQAHALETLVAFYGSQSKASKRLGISQATISSKLSLLKLSPELQADLAKGARHAEHVRNLGKLSFEEQRATADKRAAAAEERAQNNQTQPRSEPATTAEDYHAVIDEQRPSPSSSPERPSAAKPPHSKAPDAERPKTKGDHTASIPWNDPRAVVRIAQEHMSPEDFRTAGKLWHQHLELD